MRYRRAVVVLELGDDPVPALETLKRAAPALEQVVVMAMLPAPLFGGLWGEGSREPGDEALATLGGAVAAVLPSADVRAVPEPSGEAVRVLAKDEGFELAVAGSPSRRAARVLTALRAAGVAVLVPHGGERGAPVRRLICFGRGRRERLAIGTFLRDHAAQGERVTLVAAPPRDLESLLSVAGIEVEVEPSAAGAVSLERWLSAAHAREPADLVVVARGSRSLAADRRWPAPVLVLPPLQVDAPRVERPLDVADVADGGGAICVRAGQGAVVGAPVPLPDQPLAFVAGGEVVATLTSREGEVELPSGFGVKALGVYRVGSARSREPLAAVEQHLEVVRPGERPLLVFDAELPAELLTALAALDGPPAPELLAVRLRPTRGCQELRGRLRAAGLPARVLDARGVLSEGDALDVSEPLDAVRLARVGRRLLAQGFPVAAIVHRAEVDPGAQPFAVLSARALLATTATVAAEAGAAVAGPRSAIEAPRTLGGNRIALELDNALARRWLLEAIAAARRTLCFQVYMALDDEVGREVEAALAAAGARGVAVRVLVDSLHGLHGSFGATNPLLDRLSARPGVEVKVSRPITELPSLAALKQRDHRKVVVADGAVALLGGRNLSHEYYAAFDAVALRRGSTWREVPWLDGGARIEGPLVAEVSRAFHEAWVEAGGAAFEVTVPPEVGPSRARLVVHRGLRDAHGLETYLELIEGARSHVYTVNGFPLVLELQHALMRALDRGVRVRSLLGHLVPTHGGGAVFEGPWAMGRAAATELVHSRFDPLIAKGGEAWLYTVPEQPGWEPGLGPVCPHVHAKALSVDGQRCTIGSANLDITASYWESELVLVVEDPQLARGFEARIDALLAGSARLSREDPAWQQQARRRAWMRHWPGVLSI